MRDFKRFVIFAATCGVGCGGLNAGTEAPTTSGALCDETASPMMGVTEMTPLGFSAADILSFATGDFSTSLLWASPNDVVLSPESGRSQLSLQVVYDGAPIEYVRSRPTSENSVGCADHLRIGVSVRLRTDRGALDESASANLNAVTALYASFTQSLDPSALGGTLKIMPAGGDVKQLAAEVALSPLGATGQITSILETTNSLGSSARFISYGVWPASPACRTQEIDSAGLPASMDDQLGKFTGSDVLSQFNAAGALAVAWRDGNTANLTLAARENGEGCLRFPGVNALQPLPHATYPVDLSAATDDGRLSGHFVGELNAQSDVTGVLVAVGSRVDLSLAANQVGMTGFAGLGNVSQYDSLSLSLVSEAVSGSVSGEIVLNGLTMAPCTSQPIQVGSGGSTSMCEGTTLTVIERGSWQANASP